MGNLIFGTTTIQGRTFDDIKVQTSKAGVPRPIVFGTVRPIVGNIIATTAPRIEKVTEEQSGGKGGPSVEVENEEVYRTYAIRICEGPVTAVRRVWRNNELVFVGSVEEYIEETYPDEPESVWEEIAQIVAANNAQILDKAEFFLGGYDQMPSAVMQSAFGIDNVHAYRGTCYMVVDDDNLTATGGAIPQYAFEVERCEGFVLSSRPYNIENIDRLSVHPGVDVVRPGVSDVGVIDVGPGVDQINLRNTVKRYDIEPREAMDVGPGVDQINLRNTVKRYDIEPREAMDVGPGVDQINLQTIVIRYDIEPRESLDVEPGVDSIQLVQP